MAFLKDPIFLFTNKTITINNTLFCISLYSGLKELGFKCLSVHPRKHMETEYGLPDPRKEYYKFLIMRHPLERLASDYWDRLIRIKVSKLNK